MDLRRHLEVLRRFRVLVGISVLLGITLGVLALFRVSIDGGPKLTWRQGETFKSSSVLFVTQQGFPWGRAALTNSGDLTEQSLTPAQRRKLEKDPTANFADPSRFSGLATIYSFMLRSSDVRRLMPSRPTDAQIAAEPFMSSPNGNGDSLPVIGLTTTAATPDSARRLNNESIQALLAYLKHQQNVTDTPSAQRAVVSVLNPPGPAVIAQPRSKTKAIVAFLLCLIGGIALAYILENLRPRPRSSAVSWLGDAPTAGLRDAPTGGLRGDDFRVGPLPEAEDEVATTLAADSAVHPLPPRSNVIG
jgi:hypothetical protein